MYLLKPGNKKSIIAAVGLTGILLLILLIFIVIIPEYRITKMERAVSKLIRDANREIGMDYIKINNIREQCRDMIEQDKLDSGRSVLHVSYVNLQNLYVPEIKLPRYDINQTTENGLKQMHSKEAISQIKKNAKKNPPPDGKDSLNIYIGKNNIRDIAASVSSATIQSLKQEADTAMKNKCENPAHF